MDATAGQFCWVDLAASDAAQATRFYAGLFGWSAREQRANGGTLVRLQLDGRDVGSMYQLDRAHRDLGVPSHWTAYVRVADIEDAVRRAESLGAQVLVPPLAVSGMARIALVRDTVGARLGLWAPIEAHSQASGHAG